MVQQLPQGSFYLWGAKIPPPPSDPSPESLDIDMFEPSRCNFHHCKISTWKYKRLEERNNTQQPNDDFLYQFG